MDKDMGKINENIQSELLKNVRYIRHTTIRLEIGSKIIYVDPYLIDDPLKDADVIFITHTHHDHFSIKDLEKLMKKDTALVITADGEAKAKKAGFSNVKAVAPNESSSVDGIEFKTVPAYNLNKVFHPKKKGWVGYIIKAADVQYYIAGDTDNIPEMKDIKADVVFLPVGGTYTMNSAEAAEAANTIKPSVAVPIHYADVVGTVQDAQDFLKGLDSSIKGVLLK